MMSRTTFATIVGVFDALAYLCVICFSYSYMQFLATATDEEETTTMDPVKYKEQMEHATEVGAVIFGLIFCVSIVMFIFAVLMVYGVRKQRHTFIAPWVYTGVLAMIFHFFAIFATYGFKNNRSKFAYAFVCIFYAAIWYPVFKLYKKMRYCNKATKVCPVHPHATYYPATCVAAPAIQQCNTEPCNTISADFSHTGQHQTMHPNMPAACKYPTSHV